MRQYHDLHSFSHHIRQEGVNQIRAMLDEKQRKRFEELMKKTDSAPATKARK